MQTLVTISAVNDKLVNQTDRLTEIVAFYARHTTELDKEAPRRHAAGNLNAKTTPQTCLVTVETPGNILEPLETKIIEFPKL